MASKKPSSDLVQDILRRPADRCPIFHPGDTTRDLGIPGSFDIVIYPILEAQQHRVREFRPIVLRQIHGVLNCCSNRFGHGDTLAGGQTLSIVYEFRAGTRVEHCLEPPAHSLSTQMENRGFRKTRHRWVDIAKCGFWGAIVFVLVQIPLATAYTLFYRFLPSADWAAGVWRLACLYGLFRANKSIGVRVQHFQYWNSFPPLVVAIPVAGIFSATITSYWPATTMTGVPFAASPMETLFVTLIIYPLLTKAQVHLLPRNSEISRCKTTLTENTTTSDLTNLTEARLLEWLHREQAIDGMESDFLNMSERADRVLAAL